MEKSDKKNIYLISALFLVQFISRQENYRETYIFYIILKLLRTNQ